MQEFSLAVMMGFVCAVLVSRVAVRVVWKLGIETKAEPTVGGLKIHHFTYGFLIMAIAGFFAVISSSYLSR